MATFHFTSPEGTKYQIDGPEGATKEQAFQILQQQLSSEKKPETLTPEQQARREGVRQAASEMPKTAKFFRGVADVIMPAATGAARLVGAEKWAGKAEAENAEMRKYFDETVPDAQGGMRTAGKVTGVVAPIVAAAPGATATAIGAVGRAIPTVSSFIARAATGPVARGAYAMAKQRAKDAIGLGAKYGGVVLADEILGGPLSRLTQGKAPYSDDR